jgi:hypothetical protein
MVDTLSLDAATPVWCYTIAGPEKENSTKANTSKGRKKRRRKLTPD